MKTLKKSLCLVLALVMVLGLCVVGTSAAFTDEAVVAANANAYAIDVINALGIMEGDENGNFNPAGILSRAQAAKLVTMLKLGAKNAAYFGAMAVPTTGFSDVDVDDSSINWAKGYIQFCKTQGIIGGRGDGTFDPKGEVTVLQFCKMVLATLGYNGKGELEGAGWDVNTLVLAIEKNLIAAGTDTTAPVSRADAAGYLYTAMNKVVPTTYDEKNGYTPAASTKLADAGVQVAKAVVIGNAATGEKFGTKVALYNATTKDYDLTGAAAGYETLILNYTTDETAIGHEYTITYFNQQFDLVKGITYYDVIDTVETSAAVTKTAFDKLAPKPVTVDLHNYAVYTGTDPLPDNGVYLKYSTGAYVYMTVDYSVSYVDNFVKATATDPAYVTVFGDAYKFTSFYEGAAIGDLVKVVKIGDTESISKLPYSDVQVKQTSITPYGPSYNSGAFKADTADITLPASFTSATVVNGGTYRFYLTNDSTYAAIGNVPGAAVAAEYVLYIAYRTEVTADTWSGTGVNTYFAQCVNTKGEIVEYNLGTTAPTYTKGVYTVATNAYGITTLTVASDAVKVTFAEDKPLAPTATAITAAGTAYRFVADTQKVIISSNTVDKPAEKQYLVATAAAPAGNFDGAVYVVSKAITGMSGIKNAVAVWYDGNTVTKTLDVAGSYIYVANATSTGTAYVNQYNVDQKTYNFYVDGALQLNAAANEKLTATGFYTYHVDADGIYKVTAAPVGVVNSVVVNGTYNQYVLDGKLTYRNDFVEANIGSMTLVDLVAAADFTGATVPVNTMSALEALQSTKAVTLNFVVDVYGNPTGVIYLTY